MGMLMQMTYGNYTNKDAIENCIRYITRTRVNEDRQNELIGWGGMGIGCYTVPELAIQQFRGVQRAYGKDGRKLYHEVFNLTDMEFEGLRCNYDFIYQIAAKCAEYYYQLGYQVIFAVHHARNVQKRNKGVHIHFVVNSVNFMTGGKWHTGKRESYGRGLMFNQIMRDFVEERFNPLEFMPSV